MTSATTTSIPGYVAGTWDIDASHSDISFTVRHMMVSKVRGSFGKFAGEIVTGENLADSSVTASIDATSIDTNNEQRDTHLKSEDFFNAEKYGQVIFVGTKYDALNNSATLYGNLTIRGITKAVKLDVEFGGTVVDPYGQKKAGFTINGRISRKEFELKWNAVTEAGSVVVSDEVKVHAEVQMVKQQ